jgi:hypothetical protein
VASETGETGGNPDEIEHRETTKKSGSKTRTANEWQGGRTERAGEPVYRVVGSGKGRGLEKEKYGPGSTAGKNGGPPPTRRKLGVIEREQVQRWNVGKAATEGTPGGNKADWVLMV